MTTKSSTGRWLAAAGGLSAALLFAGATTAQQQPPAASLTPNAAPPVTAERLLSADKDANNWLTYHRDYAGHRFSPLDQIDTGNVKDLKVAFTFPLGGLEGGGAYTHAALEGTPLVNDGFMYVTTGWGEVFKLNVRDGFAKPVWKMDPQTDKEWSAGVACCDIDNRGVGLWKDKVVSHTLDGRLILTDDATGEIVWQRKVADPDKGETITMAPLIVKDMAITGVSGAEKAIRGWLAATDLNTGKELWRTYMVPGPGEPGFETWADDHNAWKTGGAATWGNPTYDPATNKLYFGTANPGPDFDPEYRPGDNLYVASMMVLDADTGKIDWHFQYTPNEPYDHDEIGEHPLIDVKVGGKDVKMVVHAGRNGFYYQFDRANKDFISGTQFVDKLTWTKGLDPKTGIPLDYDPNSKVQTYNSATFGLRGQDAKEDVCPTTMGGKNWQPTAYNPDLHTIYIPAIESCGTIEAAEQDKPVAEGGTWALPKSFTGARDTTPSHVSGSLVAIDVTDGKQVAKVPEDYAMWGGVLTTGGNLVFGSTADGWVKAYDAKTLKELWKFNVGSGINAPPMTYSYNGKQYVAILVGELQSAPWRGIQEAQSGLQPMSTLYVFAL
jgi:alcohol dehydrogenase (cytochrome c)